MNFWFEDETDEDKGWGRNKYQRQKERRDEEKKKDGGKDMEKLKSMQESGRKEWELGGKGRKKEVRGMLRFYS